MHTISIFVDQNRIPKLASYFECQTHLAKNLRNSANFIVRNLRTGLKKDPVDRTSNENEVLETVRRKKSYTWISRNNARLQSSKRC